MAGKINAAFGATGYPVIQLMTLCKIRTRALIGAMFGSVVDDELAWARKLLHSLDESMLVLMDRGFDAGEFPADVAATKARFPVRLIATRHPPVLRYLPNGSFTSLVGGVKVQIIAASVTVACHDGTRFGGTYRLATTLLDHGAYTVHVLMALHHERREHEITFLALRHTCSRPGCCARATQSAWNRRYGRSQGRTTNSKLLRAGVGPPDERVKQDGRCGGHPAVRTDGRGEGPAQSGVIDGNGTQTRKHLAADG